jgi:hypothetical protein
VHLDDLDAANKSMFNLAANSKARVAHRAEKRMVIQQQHQVRQIQARQEEGDIHQRLDAEMRGIEASRPKALLGASKNKSGPNPWEFEEFEDDTGFQRAQNEEHGQLLEDIYAESQDLHKQAQLSGLILADQLKQINRMTDKVSRQPPP